MNLFILISETFSQLANVFLQKGNSTEQVIKEANICMAKIALMFIL